MKTTRPNELDVIFRIRSPQGWVISEWIVRNDRVELIDYFPSGGIQSHTEVDISTFTREFMKKTKATKGEQDAKADASPGSD